MASLTGQLPTENRGKAVINGDAAAPSFLSGLLNTAGQAVNAFGPMQKRMEAEKTKQALNDAEQAQFDFLSAKEQELNPAYKSAGDELAKQQTAEKQGRAPAGSTDLRAEKVISDLYSRFPADKASIAQYLQGRGFDHYLFQAVKQEEKWKELEADSERYLYEKSYKAAVDNGLADPTDDMATIKAGQAFLHAQAQLEIATKQATEARANAAEGREQAKWEASQADKDMVTSAAQIGGVYINSLVPKFASMLSSAAGNENRTKMMNELRPQIVLSVEAHRAQILTQMRGAGASKDAIDAFNAQLDNSLKSIDTLFNASYEANKRAVETMKLKFEIDDATALPAYSRVVRLLGQEAANSVFANDPASSLPPEVLEQMKKEIKGFQTGDANEASVTLNNIVQIREGVKGLQDMTEEEARKVLPTIVTTSRANQMAVNRGNLSSARDFINTQSQVINAASELQPGLTDIASVRKAVDAIANPQMWQTFQTLSKDPTYTQRTEALIVGNRGATAQLLRVAQQAGPDVSADGVWSIKWDNSNGTYKVQADKKKLAEMARKADKAGVTAVEGMILPTAGGATTDLTTIPAHLKTKADTMNMALNHLVATSGFDDELPTGATKLGLRAFYAKGTPPVTTTGEAAASPDQQWRKAYNNLYREVQDVAVTGGASTVDTTSIQQSFKGASISPGDAVSRLSSYGVPSHIAHGIVGNLIAESGLKTGAVGDGGKALSLAQWHPDRQANAKANGFDLSNPNDAIDFVLWELNNTESKAKARLAKARTVQEAADIFALYFLRPAGAQTGSAENIDNIKGRRKYAMGLAGGG